VFSAKGAAFTPKSATGRIRRGEPGAASQDHENPKTPALKARFTSRSGQLNRAFSACLHDDLNSWGDAPGCFKTAPLALNRNVRRLKLAFDTDAASRLPN
jgi:hypothetical protein